MVIGILISDRVMEQTEVEEDLQRNQVVLARDHANQRVNMMAMTMMMTMTVMVMVNQRWRTPREREKQR
jgi:hypothetical protein